MAIILANFLDIIKAAAVGYMKDDSLGACNRTSDEQCAGPK